MTPEQMMSTIKIILWTLFISIFCALLEIQVEGKDGWAKHLPTFRINMFFKNILGGKPLTGYHLFLILLFITVFHGVFLFKSWSWKIEANVFGLICWFFVLEDFFWFVFNKHYGLSKFKSGHITWHLRWAFGLPVTYWWGMIIGTTLLYIAK